ncbi:hypothetical protein MLD52_05010 [Puniceicoccaceae bacterium K14]|nr:hypothetical protein [Puniceicoccaceae bacterium K14]
MRSNYELLPLSSNVFVHRRQNLNEDTIRELLKEIDIPNLWKPNPNDWIQIEDLPLLGTGKLDFRSLNEITKNSF